MSAVIYFELYPSDKVVKCIAKDEIIDFKSMCQVYSFGMNVLISQV